MAEIRLRGVTKRYPDGTEAVKAIDLTIADGEFMILVGPSGCGKSTALRMIGGLEDISEGEMLIGDEVVNDRPEHFEDAAVAEERGTQGMRSTANVDVVESMGSELYVYFDVKAAAHAAELDGLAEDAGLSELPGQSGEGTHVVARLDPTGSAAAGRESELMLDTSQIKLFDPDGGRNLSVERSAATPV